MSYKNLIIIKNYHIIKLYDLIFLNISTTCGIYTKQSSVFVSIVFIERFALLHVHFTFSGIFSNKVLLVTLQNMHTHTHQKKNISRNFYALRENIGYVI